MIGGFSGLVLGALSTNVHLHDTHFVVAHFHFIVFGGTGFAFLAHCITGSLKCLAGNMMQAGQTLDGLSFFIGFVPFMVRCSILV
jgi:cytochrome c oxidase subunit I